MTPAQANQARITWMRKLLGGWAMIGFDAYGNRLIVECRHGVSRPPS